MLHDRGHSQQRHGKRQTFGVGDHHLDMRNGGLRIFSSTEAHGEWGSLIGFYPRHCANLLHRHHRLAAFDTPAETDMHLGWVRTTFELAKHAITTFFDAYGADVAAGFDRCLTTMVEARRAAR